MSPEPTRRALPVTCTSTSGEHVEALLDLPENVVLLRRNPMSLTAGSRNCEKRADEAELVNVRTFPSAHFVFTKHGFWTVS